MTALYTETIIEFNHSLHDNNYSGDRLDLSINITDLLYYLLQKWSSYNNTLELYLNAKNEDLGNVVFLYDYDEKSGIHLRIGMYEKGIYLDMNLACPENLPKMPDTFWLQWLELNNYGEFEMLENEPFNIRERKKYPTIFPENESNIFMIMRNLIAFPIVYGWPNELGLMSVTWPYEKYSLEEVVNKGCLAFERMHQLNNFLTAAMNGK